MASELVRISTCDEVVRSAAAEAADGRIYPAGSSLEKDLVAAVRRRLDSDRRVDATATEVRYTLGDWTRPPGGVDLAVDLGPVRLLMEMKVGKPDESLWDAVKLADIVAQETGCIAGYLVYDSGASGWRPGQDCIELFGTEPLGGSVESLIRRWPKAWMYLMLGGRGIRPIRSVAEIDFTVIGTAPLAAHPGHEIRVLRVLPASKVRHHYDAAGWPEGYDPPGAMRQRITEADALAAAPERAPEEDECHGYPWYPTWTQSRLDVLVPQLDDAAFRCLRVRLNRERRWTEAELRSRVDPLRALAG